MVTYGGTAFHRLWQDINNNSCNILLLTPLCSRVQRDNCELRVGRCYVWCGVAMCGVGTNVAVVSAEEESSQVVEIRIYRKIVIIHGDQPKRVKTD